jgi:hypothetical protein
MDTPSYALSAWIRGRQKLRTESVWNCITGATAKTEVHNPEKTDGQNVEMRCKLKLLVVSLGAGLFPWIHSESAQMVKKFHRTRRFTTTFMKTHHWDLS